MDERSTPAGSTPRRRRMRAWGAVAGSLAVVGGLSGTGAVAAPAQTAVEEQVPVTFRAAPTAQTTTAQTTSARAATPSVAGVSSVSAPLVVDAPPVATVEPARVQAPPTMPATSDPAVSPAADGPAAASVEVVPVEVVPVASEEPAPAPDTTPDPAPDTAPVPTDEAEPGAESEVPEEPVTPEEPAMPEGYTAEQYDAFWGAGYTWGDAVALAELWATDETSAKSKAGQALLDGQPVPLAPGTVPDAPVEDADPLWTAFAGSGYTYDDAVALADLWATDVDDAKARIGQAVLDGADLPIAPGTSSPAAG